MRGQPWGVASFAAAPGSIGPPLRVGEQAKVLNLHMHISRYLKLDGFFFYFSPPPILSVHLGMQSKSSLFFRFLFLAHAIEESSRCFSALLKTQND